jgi:hypothetical protein
MMAVIRVYDAAGNVIETHERKGEFKEPSRVAGSSGIQRLRTRNANTGFNHISSLSVERSQLNIAPFCRQLNTPLMMRSPSSCASRVRYGEPKALSRQRRPECSAGPAGRLLLNWVGQ